MREARATTPLLDLLESLTLRHGQLVHVETLAPRNARFGELAQPLPTALERGLAEQGIEHLFTHQAEALALARGGENVVVVTGTASGKTLCYNLPVLEAVLDEPEARALYLFPTKALAQDQLKGLKRWLPDQGEVDPKRRRRRRMPEGGEIVAPDASLDPKPFSFRAGVYDGDTPTTLRSRLREEANLLLTNPDMLHASILPHHARWATFFAQLRYVVVDEIHVYRGIFGSHVANVLRRLRRICRHHGSDPIWICASATIANPRELAERLTGLPFAVVDQDGSPRGRKHFILWNPPPSGPSGMERRSTNLEARDLLVRLVREGYQTIAFVKARLLTEVLLRYCQEELRADGSGLAKRIRAYRAGYLPEERRKIEAALFEGELLGVISTNALELGVDVGTLDAALLVGYPGTIASTWQQAGRAGRRQDESAAILLGHNAPIDQYLMSNPAYFFGQSPEHAILDPGNAHILLNHLRCAAFEIPIPRNEEEAFGEFAPALLALLEERAVLKEVKGRSYYAREDYPAASFSLRNSGDHVYTIVERSAGSGDQAGTSGNQAGTSGNQAGTSGNQGGTSSNRAGTSNNRVIGTIDEPSVFSQAHPQAIYLQEGETYFVDDLDLREKVAYVHRADVDYYTQAVSDGRVEALHPELEKSWREATAFFGGCRVHDQVTMFKKIKFGSRDSLGYGPVDLPPITLLTTALWLVPSALALRQVLDQGRVPADGLAGIAHVLSAVISLHAMCDPMDLGTVVEMRNPAGPTLFVYDKYPGGLGYAQRAYHLLEQVMQDALGLIRGCPCEDGCPSCVGSPILPHYAQDPDAAAKGRIPDKEAAQILLHALLELPSYQARRPLQGPLAERARRVLERSRTAQDRNEAGEAANVFAPPDSTGVSGEMEGDAAARSMGGDSHQGAGRDARADAARGEPRRIVRALPTDLRERLLAQLEHLSQQAQASRRR